MTTASLYPAIRPTLDLNFAATETLDPRITFSRASTGTYYDGKTVAKAEENLVLQSQAFDETVWQKTGSPTISNNSTTAPDGTATADTINGAIGSSYIGQSVNAVVSGLQYTISIFAKKNTTNFLQVAAGGAVFGTAVWANFDLDTGTIGTTGASTTASIQSAGNGWYRCIITGTSTAVGSSGLAFALIPVESSSASRFPSNSGTTSIYAWGAQLEQRSAVTAYTPTTTQPITNYIPVLLTALAGVARLDHNPTTGESLGLLIEEQRTNLLTYSEQFNIYTAIGSYVSANVIVAPDGSLSADKFVNNSGISGTGLFGANGIYQNCSTVSGSVYTFSIYVKAGESNTIGLSIADSNFGTNGVRATANLGTVTTTNLNNASSSLVYVGNGWYRFIVTSTTTQSVTGTPRCYIYNPTTGDGYSGIYIWGAQLEAGAFPTSYIPTVASQVTRSADSASMTGSNFSSWYRADEGTLYAETASAALTVSGTSRRIANINNGTENYKITIAWAGSTGVGTAYVTDAGVTQANFTSPSGAYQFPTKVALAYKTNDFNAAVNNSAFTTDTSGTVPVVDRMTIGDVVVGGNGTQNLNGTIKRITYYPARLTNTQLQAITS